MTRNPHKRDQTNRHLIIPTSDDVRCARGLYATGSLDASEHGLYALGADTAEGAPE